MTQSNETHAHYPTAEANPDFVKLEDEILAFWKREQVFEKSVEKNRDKGDYYVFYDGPPFANGLPHYGHLLTGYVKDLIARYQTMRGKVVERRFGWDCHGLPAEMGAEKELGISGRQAIIEYGIGKFNDYCRNNVMRYASEWERYVDRQGRWVDFQNDYKTMDRDFMESVIWAFSELYKKGLIYESYRVMPYSWAAETPLSNFETRLDNATREKEDKAITVAFELNEVPKALKEEIEKFRTHTNPRGEFLNQHISAKAKYFIVAWTTTPWTLPSNLALAVSKDLNYKPFFIDGNVYIAVHNYFDAAKAVLQIWDSTADEGKGAVGTTTIDLYGKDLIGLTYKPLFPYFAHLKDSSPLAGEHDAPWRVGGGKTNFATEKAQAMRKEPTEAEKKLWSVLKGEQLGYKFRRQQPVGNYIVDFYNAEKRLVIEVDGGQHAESAKDDERTAWLESQGLKVLRLWNNEVLENLEGVLATIADVLKNTPHAVSDETAAPPQGGSSSGAFRILDGSDFIEEGSGTGVVHMAPGFGEDDQRVCEANGISIVCPVDDKGCYTDEIFDLTPHPNPLPSGEREATANAGAGEGALKLKGLNVIADTNKSEDEPYTDAQLHKYGLANLRIIQYLKQTGQLIKQEDFKHNYPHCWRTDTPIIYRALPSWYVKVTDYKERAVALNQNINWIPGHTRDGAMGHMLASAPDWSISRNRFWGCPIPVWKSDNPENKKEYVFGSIKELEEFFGPHNPHLSSPSKGEEKGGGAFSINDLHRPFIDELTAPDPEDPRYTLRRVEEVLDCWFESGSMPYAQLHYPFENADKFKDNYPGDFITEYIGQTRGWFNTLIMLATALFEQEPFKNCICHGVVIDEETGLKYSKRLKNYKDPMEVFDTFGADALRWLMVSSGVMRGHDLGVDPEGKFIRDVVRLNIKPIWNAYNFFTLYANADGMKAEFSTDSENLMDQYILAKCRAIVDGIQSSLDAYDTPGACNAVTQFVEVLNNWYIRRCRPRFWAEEMSDDKKAAYNTLYTVLHTLCRSAAPLLPFTLEAVFRGLTGEKGSVHLEEFPAELAEYKTKDTNLAQAMDFVRDVCNAALSVRNKTNIRVRQPLHSLKIIADIESLKAMVNSSASNYYADLIRDETNIKNVGFSGDADDLTKAAELKLAVHFPIVGKRLPAMMKQIIPASKKGEWKKLDDGRLEIAGAVLEPEEFSLKLEPKAELNESAQPLSTNDALVVLDLELTPELIAEGMARDVVRMVQESRKQADLHVSDKISLVITAPEKVAKAVEVDDNRRYIAEQVLAASIAVGQGGGEFSFEHELEGEKVVISFSKVA